MPYSPVDLCNHALAAIGVSQFITDLTESSTEARVCLLKYGDTRDDCLAEYDWGFARRYVQLAATTFTPPLNWTYAYAYPSDCVRILGFPVQSSTDLPDYLLEFERYVESDGTQLIAANLQTPTLAYIQRTDAVATWPTHFHSAVIYALAAEIAMPLTKSPTLAGAMRQRADQEMDNAKATAAKEQRLLKPQSRLIAARNGMVRTRTSTSASDWFTP